MRFVLLSVALIVGASSARAAIHREALWVVLQSCLVAHKTAGTPFPCLAVNLASTTDPGYAVQTITRAGITPVRVAEGFRLEAAMANAGLTWTAERIERLKELWTEGLSASEIAAELGEGVSRNAVLGKAHRLGLAQGERKGASMPRPRKPPHSPDPAPAAEPPP